MESIRALSSGSSKSSSNSSSHEIYIMKRESARLAVAIFKSKGGEIHYQGTTYRKVAGQLGNNDEARYNADPPILYLQKIYYCQRKLEELNSKASGSSGPRENLEALTGEHFTPEDAQQVEKIRGLINHEYLVLELQASPTEKLHIHADKRSGPDPGIHVDKALPEDYDKKKVVLLEIHCGGVPMKLNSLVDRLSKADIEDYNLRNNNCWDYALRATKVVLNECILGARSGVEEVARLQEEIRNLEANLTKKGIVHTWKKASEWYSSRK